MLAPIGILTPHPLGASVKKVRKPSGLRPQQQLRQLGDVGGDAPGLVARQRGAVRSPSASVVAMLMAPAHVSFSNGEKKPRCCGTRMGSFPAPVAWGRVGRCTAGSEAGSIRRRSSSAR